MKNTKVSKVMLSTLVTGGLVYSSLFAVSAYNEVQAPSVTKGEAQIELPSSALKVFRNDYTLRTSFEEVKQEAEKLEAERKAEQLRIELEKARQAEEARLAKIEADRKAKEEAERKERERLAKIEAEKRAEAQRQAEIKAQQIQAKVQQSQSTEGIAFNGSYYTPYCNGCSGVTATGYNVKNTIYYNGMRIIATDPRVIPMYSIVEVSTPYETFKAIALDRGGAIKGHKVDILVADKSTAYRLGRHTVYIKVLQSGK